MIKLQSMNYLKPYSCSLKHINTKNILQCQNMTNYLREYTLSNELKEQTVFSPKITQNKIKKGDVFALIPFRVLKKSSNDKKLTISTTKKEDIRSTSETRGTTQNTIVLPVHQKLAVSRQVRSRFEQKIDEMMNQVIKQQKLPFLNKNTTLHMNQKNYRNIRILTETTDHQNKYKKQIKTNDQRDNDMSHVIKIIINQEKVQQQKKRKKVFQQETGCRINTHLNSEEAAKNSKELQWYYPITKYIQQQEQRTLRKVIDCHKYLRHFRESKSSVKDLHLHKY